MQSELKEIYIKFNFPGKEKLNKILKKENIKVSNKQLNEFIAKQEINQVFNEPVKRRGRTVSFQYLDRVQIDILNMDEYSIKNKGFSYIMLIIDIFTRKLLVFLLKKRDQSNVETALTEFINKHKPNIIISDNEASFMSKRTQKLFDDNNIKHINTEPTDHKALGVIDRISRTIKTIIVKHMKYSKSTTYIDSLPTILKMYNDTPHPGILNLTPNEATLEENYQLLFDYNLEKAKNNKSQQNKLKVGDQVRIRNRKKTFERAYDKKYSDIQTVEELTKTRATLNDGKSVSLRRLKKVEPIDINLMKEERNEQVEKPLDAIDLSKKDNKIKKAISRAGLESSNIVEGKRERKPNLKYSS